MRPLDVAAVPPQALWGAWSPDPAVLAGLALAAVLYARGYRALRQGVLRMPGRSLPGRAAPVSRRQAGGFSAGLVLLAVALVSPLDGLDATLLTAHMAQHLLLLVVAPPLLVYGRPGLVLPLGLPVPARRRLGRFPRRLRRVTRLARNPLVVLALVTAALWGWHLPAAYSAALGSPTLHAAEHLSFLLTSLAFWRLVIDPRPRRRLGYAPAMVLSFAVMLQSAALGAAIAFSPAVLYPAYSAGASLWHVSALGDQQLAGALMWIPPGGLYLVTIVALGGRWFRDVERRMHRREQSGEPAPTRSAPARAGMP